MQSVADVDSGLIMTSRRDQRGKRQPAPHPMSMATMEVLEVDEPKVLADGGYSNAQRSRNASATILRSRRRSNAAP